MDFKLKALTFFFSCISSKIHGESLSEAILAEDILISAITIKCLYTFDPLKPHIYIVKLGFTGVYIIFLFLLKNIDLGYLLEPPRRGGSNEYPKSMFWAEIWKISEFFLSENFHFFEVKVSIYLNRRVFVMHNVCSLWGNKKTVCPESTLNLKLRHRRTLVISRPRDSLNHFEISVPRHIKLAEMRKIINRTARLTNEYVIWLLKLEIYWKYCGKEEQFLLFFYTIFCYLLLGVPVKTGTRFSLLDKRLFEIRRSR